MSRRALSQDSSAALARSIAPREVRTSGEIRVERRVLDEPGHTAWGGRRSAWEGHEVESRGAPFVMQQTDPFCRSQTFTAFQRIAYATSMPSCDCVVTCTAFLLVAN